MENFPCEGHLANNGGFGNLVSSRVKNMPERNDGVRLPITKSWISSKSPTKCLASTIPLPKNWDGAHRDARSVWTECHGFYIFWGVVWPSLVWQKGLSADIPKWFYHTAPQATLHTAWESSGHTGAYTLDIHGIIHTSLVRLELTTETGLNKKPYFIVFGLSEFRVLSNHGYYEGKYGSFRQFILVQ